MSRPNKVRLTSLFKRSIVELPVRVVRKMVEQGSIKVVNPDSLYCRI